MKTIFIYALIVWVVLLFLAILNAGIRNSVYKPVVGDLFAHQISSVIFIAVIFGATYVLLKIPGINYVTMDLILIGVIWVSMTVIFEFGFGHYVMGNTWEKLLGDYNILEGRIWSLVLVANAVAPVIVSKFV